MRWCSERLVLAFSALLASAQLAFAIEVRVQDPRDFGRFIGDTITREIIVHPDGKESVNVAALPRPGPVTYWLDLVSVSTDDEKRNGKPATVISLTYQIFYAALEPKRMRIPGFPLYLRSVVAPEEQVRESRVPDTNTRSIAIPPLETIVSPIREIIPANTSGNGETEVLKPDVSAQTTSARHIVRRMLAIAAALIVGILALLYHFALPPFHARQARPFSKAIRQLSSLPDNDAVALRDAVQRVHRAFDETNGGRLLRSGVTRFLARNPRFQSLEAETQAFFISSANLFFGTGSSSHTRDLSRADLLNFVRRLARAERGAR